MKKRKQALLHSVISLLLCFSMLVGTTFAWFTDSVVTGLNTIAAGNLDVELYHTNAAAKDERVDSATKLFLDLQGDPILWEPGAVSYENLRIANEGDLALAYQLLINTANENHVVDASGAQYGLSQILKVGVVEGGITATDRAGVVASVADANWTTLANFIRSGSLLPEDAGESEKTWGIVIYWQPGEFDNYWNLNNGKQLDQGEYLMIDLGIKLIATQEQHESDSFGNDYDATAKTDVFPVFVASGSVTTTVIPNDQNQVAADLVMTTGQVTASVPSGVQLADGTTELTMTVAEMDESGANLTLGENEAMRSLDVHIEGVASDNTVPMIIDLGEVMPTGLNMGNYTLYHVENGATNAMKLVDAPANHNEYSYDPATGRVVVAMASFSELTLVADTVNAWNGDIAEEFAGGTGTETDPYIIANADQLAYLNKTVSEGDSISKDKYYKLIADINFGGSSNDHIWYPIGYWAKGEGTNKASEEIWYTYGDAFQGVFDGTGHTITGIYQNTWAMDGNYDNGYWNAAMGLFGYVYNGTIKNLTIDNFYSEGEFAPTGCVAAYAAGEATFENIAITNSHPQTYNTGVAGIVGWDNGSDTEAEASKFTFKNITVDSSNTISALWGSWDVAAAGLLGYLGEYSTADLENCNVSATIDVYNDVCGNYQYYWYRYCGMMIGTVDKTKDDGSLNLSNITATNCTVDFGDRHEYYYCEFFKNSKASYTHDYQFSRVSNDDIVGQGDSATCKNHDHDSQGKEIIDGKEVLVEDKQAVYLPFRQLFGGYGWGVDGVDQEEYPSIEIYSKGNVEKFTKNSALTGDFLYRVGNKNEFPIGKLFQEVSQNIAVDSGVYVEVTPLVDGVELVGTFVKNEDDWTQSTLHITGGTGPAKLTIQDYNNCEPFELIVEVVDAKNVTQYSEMVNTSCVMLNDITMSTDGKYSLYDNQTLYGNGFTFNVSAGLDSDTEGGSVSENGTVWVRNSTLDNVVIVGESYSTYGGAVKSEYNFPTVLVLGNSVIANSYISNGCAAVRVGSGANIEIIDTTLEGGVFANLDIRGGKIKLHNVTTINQTNADGTSANKDGSSVGLGIVVYSGSTVTIDIDGLTQNNCVSKNTTFAATEANTLKNAIFGTDYKKYQFSYNNATWVNTGILSMVQEVTEANFSKLTGYAGQKASISSFNGYVYAPTGLTSVTAPGSYESSNQYHIAPTYSFDYTSKNNVPQESGSNDYCVYDETSNKYLISFDKGESFVWDAGILSVKKGGTSLPYSVSVSEGAVLNADNTITFDTAGDYIVTYRYTDEGNYRLNGDEVGTYSTTYEKTVNITVYEVEDTSAKTKFAFGSNGYRTEIANNITYVMPDVNATVDSNTAGIGMTTVGGVAIYYPVVSMHKSGSSSWYNYFSVFESVTITDLNGTVYNTSTTELPSGLTVIGGFILDANGNVSTAESANGTGIFNYSTGKEIKCATYSSYGLCYYPDSQFSKSTNSRDEQTIVVKYRYTDSNGTPYYYYVGYWCEKHTKSSTCVTPDTLITLADGTQKEIQHVTNDDLFVVWDFYKGEYTVMPASIVMNHGYDLYDVVTLNFDDGTTVKTINGHGFFDATENKFVILSKDNVEQYIGHAFVKDALKMTTTKLVSYSVKTEYTESWSVLTAVQYNCVLEGMLTLTPAEVEGSPDYLMPFEVGEDMKFDEAKMQADIAKYGQYTYEDFADYVTYEQFVGFGFSNWKVAVGKGYITWNDILYLLSIHVG